MADTKDFDVIRIARTDGADTGPGYWPVAATAAPSAAKKSAKELSAAEKAPRAKAPMTRLEEDDPRFVEYRIKLGILLKQELSPNPEDGNSWYVNFPRGYWLYEKSKHLWVSGYPLKAKLYKSPQEFGVHLLWLLSASRDYKDCCCVHCNGQSAPRPASATEDTLTITPSELPAKSEKIPPKVTPVPLPTIPGQPHTKLVVAPLRPTPPPAQAVAPPASAVPVAAAAAQPPPPPQATLWPMKASLLFRVGELVWYQNGNTWRLGVVVSSGPGGHELLPIGHGSVQHPNVSKADGDMRPYHAFSVPPVSIPELKDKVFDEIPWDAMFQGSANESGKTDLLALDASKMAALKIDYSYSLWSPMPPMPDDPTGKMVVYYGCFLGAERIEIGDCLRLKPPPAELNIASETVVMGLRTIFTSADYQDTVFLRGSLYIPAKPDAAAATLPDSLPAALRDETQWRAQFSPPPRWRWALVAENVVLKEDFARGRFYPTNRLMPVLNPAGFQAAVARGQVDDQYAHLNNRMDGGGRFVGRVRNRLETLGAAVAHGARFATEAHVREEGV